MAGNDPTGAFNSQEFIANIQSVMTMALPNTTADQPTFHWNAVPSYASADSAGQPFYFGATPVSDVVITDYQALCAVTIGGNPEGSTGTDAGEFSEFTARITMLEPDYTNMLVHGNGNPPDIVYLGGKTYDITQIPMNQALFNVDVWIIMAVSRDET